MKITPKYTLNFFIVGLLIICLMSMFYFYSNRNEAIQNVQNQLLTTTNDTAYHVHKELIKQLDITLAISRTPLLKQILTESNQYFTTMEEDSRTDLIDQLNTEWMASDSDSPFVRSKMKNDIADYFTDIQNQFPDLIGEIFLTNTYGAVVSTTKKLTTYAHAQKYWWKAAYNEGTGLTYFDDRGFDESVEGYVLGIVIPVKDGKTVIGVLKINYLLDTLLQAVVNEFSLEGRELMISRLGGEIVKELGKVPLSTVLDNSISQWIQTSQTNDAVLFNREKENFISYTILEFTTGHHFGGTSESSDHSLGNQGEPWVIVSTYEQNIALSGFYTQMWSLAVSGIILLLGLAIVSIILSRLMVHPIKELVLFSRRVGSGDFDAQILSNRTDEFGILTQAVNTMVSNLSATMASRDELETQISLRKKEEEKYRQLFTTMSEGFATHEIILDEQQNPVNYRFLSVNPAFERETGLKASEILGKTVLEVLPGIEEFWIKEYGEIALNGNAEIFDQFSSAINKHFRVNVFSPAYGEFATIFSDISNLKKAEQQLKDDKVLLTTILNSISAAVLVSDTAGNITYINEEAKKLMDWSIDEALENTVVDICNFLHFNEQECPLLNALKKGKDFPSQTPLQVHLLDDRNRKIECMISSIFTNKEKVSGLVIVLKDVTAKEKQREIIIRSEKLDSLGILAGGIAHDFNNYLSGIFGYIELTLSLLKNTGAETEIEYLQLALAVFEKAKGLTQQLLTFSKGGTPKASVVDIDNLLRSCTDFVLSGSNISPRYEFGENLWTGLCDIHQIEQCISNLVINAKQAMPGGGEIVITAENFSAIPHRFDVEKEVGDFIKIGISDEGEGIPPEIVTKIYDPFFSTKKTGHGLGLATVYSIIEKHNGWIDAVSTVGKGTTFTLYLPAGLQNTEREKEKVASDFHYGAGQILVMDDQEFMREMLTEMLQALAYTVTAVASGKEAISAVEKSLSTGPAISACILDLTLPGDMDGKEVVRKIKQAAPELVCIASSGYADDPVMAAPKSFGFTDSIAKPFKLHELSQVLKDALEAESS